MKKVYLLGACAAAALGSANAVEVTFDLTLVPDEATSWTLMSDGVSLTIDNPQGQNPVLRQGLGGLAFSDSSSAISADFTFSQDVTLVSYVVSNDESDGNGAFFDLTQGGVSSLNNSVSTLGLQSFTNTASTFLGGLAIAMVGGDFPINGGNEFEAWAISSLTVSIGNMDPVPVPAAALLMGPVLAGMAARRRAKRTA
ncbi:MAG: hypothetical protein AAF830_14305 [Pseudomonadota bacterium]